MKYCRCDVRTWPFASVRCGAAIRPVLGVKLTCPRHRSIDAIDPEPDIKVQFKLRFPRFDEASAPAHDGSTIHVLR